MLTASGTLTVSDVDNAAEYTPATVGGTYGSLAIGADGSWSYTADSAHNEFVDGTTYSDTFTVSAVDGTTTTVTVNIVGTNDAAVLSTATASLSETDAVLTASGTLTVSDVDNAAEYTPATVGGTYGSLAIGADGSWSYTADSAHNEFVDGTTYSDTFTVSAVDGTTTTVTVNIVGTNDAAVLSTATASLSETDAVLTASGTLTVSDVDNAAEYTPATVGGTYGSLAIGADGSWSYTADSAHNEFVDGTTYSDTFTVSAVDGTTTTVTVNIVGTNDAAVLSTATASLSETDAVLTASGTLTVSDVDNAAEYTPATVGGTYGSLAIGADGSWSYTADSAHNEFVDGTTYSDTFTVSAVDGTTTTVTVNIVGTNDAAVLSTATASLSETDAVLTASGTLTVSDVDNAAEYTPATVGGTYGSLAIGADGSWSYTADSAHNEFVDGTTYSDTFTVSAVDGTTTTVTVNIVGTNDAAVLSTATASLSETDAVLTASGTLTVSDVDNAAEYTPATVGGTYGSLAIGADGSWSYTADSAHNEFVDGTTYSDTFTVSAVDGTTTTVTVNIVGTNDAAVLSTATVPIFVSPVTPVVPAPPGVSPGVSLPSDAIASVSVTTEAVSSQQLVDPGLIAQPVNLAGSLSGSSNPSGPAVPATGESPADVVNALPPPAAGAGTDIPLTSPSDQGFRVELISQTVLGDRGGELESLTGARLFVLEGVADVQADKQYQIPAEAFAHTDASAQIRLEARQSNGAPLPGWLQFNQTNGTFSGTPPDGVSAAVEVQVLAHDSQSREASVIFKLELGVAGAGTGSAGIGIADATAERGFALTRIGADSATGASLGADSGQPLSGDRLFVLEGVSSAVGEQRYQLPQSAFAHTDAKAVVTLEARQANGMPLPAWLQFDPVSGLFRGTPPDGTPVAIDVIVVAHDGAARQASVVFKLEMGVTGADAQGAAPTPGEAESPFRQGSAPVGPRAEIGIGAQRTVSSSTGTSLGDAQRFAESGLAAQQTAFAEASAAAGLGFPVARVPVQDILRVAAGDGFAAGDQRLFVYQGIFVARGEGQYQVPLDAFGHSDPSAIVRLEARSADGSPLPFWLHFDSLTGTFRGTPPGGQHTALEIILMARDEEGREASLEFTLELGVKIADEAPVKADSAPTAPAPRARADADEGDGENDPDAVAADGKDGPGGEKDKLEKGKPVRVGAAPFGEQVKVAKAARDPLLAKILGEKVKPGGRPIV